VDFLTYTYNASLVYTYNMAIAGSVVDHALVVTTCGCPGLTYQVGTSFLPHYSKVTNPNSPWDSSTTLFAFWFGINDVNNSYLNNDTSVNDKIFAEYLTLVEQVYAAGARNFLFLNVPPINLSPSGQANNLSIQTLEADDIADFNAHVPLMIEKLQAQYADVNAFEFDLNTFWHEILAKPSTAPETAGIKNVTDDCADYNYLS
jgi:phospholipase/lecithinase/hemolysin